MKDLLTAIKQKLQTELGYVRDADIFITEDEMLLPEAVKFPAVAIKDGRVTRTLDDKTTIGIDARVRVSAYAQVLKVEQSVMGDRGVLQMTADIIAALEENNLGLDGVYHAFATSIEASRLFGDRQEMIQKQTVELQYLRFKPR